MKKQHPVLFSLLLAVCMCLFLGSGSAFAESPVVLVEDQAGLLTQSEIESLNGTALKVFWETSWNVFVVTTDESDEAQLFAEEFFLEHASGDDGIVCLIDMENRELYLATSGTAIDYITDQRLEGILDDAYGGASNGDYKKALEEMLSGALSAYRKGIPGGHYRYDEDTGEITYTDRSRSVSMGMLLGAAIAFLVVTALVYGGVTGRYQMTLGGYKYDWRSHMKGKISLHEDRFVNRFVTRRHIPRNPPPSGGGGGHGGGSSVHTGSGGHTFGGGGRKF